MTIFELANIKMTILLNTLTLCQGTFNKNTSLKVISLLSNSSTLKNSTVEGSSQQRKIFVKSLSNRCLLIILNNPLKVSKLKEIYLTLIIDNFPQL